MKKLLFFLLIIANAPGVSAQKSNLVFFAENGEPFYIVMNGLRYNEQPQTNVKLEGLTAPATYKVKAIFDDATLGQVTKTIPLEAGVEYTYNIRLKKKTEIGQAVKRAGRQVKRDMNMIDSSEVDAEQPEIYVMRFVSETPLYTAAPVPVAPAPTAVVVQSPPPPQPVRGTVTQTTTVQTTGTPNAVVTPGAGVNMSVNDPEMGVNFNMSVGVPGTVTTGSTQVQQTTTTTTYSNTPPPVQQQQVYVMPGYNGPVGCPWPMDQASFNSAIGTINNQTFEDNKLQIAKQVIGSNCVTSAQVAQIMGGFTFEESKLDFAKFAYGRTFDIGNYFVVNNAFTFSSSVDELNDYIATQPRR
ncbi:MAG: DUF4476 domain-containing protein [Bacteroidetes bacterium]|nr:DUF4476 domain-containing protein [Bacteroidota bacterium]